MHKLFLYTLNRPLAPLLADHTLILTFRYCTACAQGKFQRGWKTNLKAAVHKMSAMSVSKVGICVSSLALVPEDPSKVTEPSPVVHVIGNLS